MTSDYIIVCVSESPERREDMIASQLIKAGFANIKSDAKKIIKHTIADSSIEDSYFIAVSSYSFTASASNNIRLIHKAARGHLVVLGAKKVPRDIEAFVEIVYK